jgi:hypothetical protein
MKVKLSFCTYGRGFTIGANPVQGPLEGVGPENQDFFGPEMATRVPHKKIDFSSGPKKSRLSRTSNRFARIKII